MNEEIRKAFEDQFESTIYTSHEDYYTFSLGWQASRQNIGVVPPFEKECPECEGVSHHGYYNPELAPNDEVKPCSCRYLTKDRSKWGTVPIFYTPEEYTAWMREHVDPEWVMPDTMAVWKSHQSHYCNPKISNNWRHDLYGSVMEYRDLPDDDHCPYIMIVATEAGKPDKDWRPKDIKQEIDNG